MQAVLASLRCCADPTRLRLLGLTARGAFCVTELTAILGQSQPRLSRHLKLLVEAGLLDCSREGSHAWFSLVPGGLGRAVLEALPDDDPTLREDARTAARVVAERSRAASAAFREQGQEWDEMRAHGLPAERVEAALLAVLGEHALGDVLDLGTGTGRALELLAPQAHSCLGIDASFAMLALARGRLAERQLANCRVRRADAYRLPLPSSSQDVVMAQMLLHHAEDPPSMLREAARVLRPGGMLLVIDLEAPAMLPGLRWPGFANQEMRGMLAACGLAPRAGIAIPGPATVRLWPARAPAAELLQ